MSRLFAVIEPVYHGLNAVAAEWEKTNFSPKAFSYLPSKGFIKGRVMDFTSATDSIIKVLARLREKTGKRIQEVYAAVSSASINLTPSSGVLLLSKYGREVNEIDITRCVEIASAIKMPLDKEILHKIVCSFSLDGEEEITNPLNLDGVKLESKVNLVTISSSVLHNMSKCISQAGFVPSGFIFSGLAASYRALTKDDLKEGAALLNIDKDIIEVLIFNQGILVNCKVFSTGLNNLMIDEERVNQDILKDLSRQVMNLSGWDKIQQIVVIGEGTLIEDLVTSIEESFNYPIKVGSCISRSLENLPQERLGYITSLGILDYLYEKKMIQERNRGVVKRALDKIWSFIDSYF